MYIYICVCVCVCVYVCVSLSLSLSLSLSVFKIALILIIEPIAAHFNFKRNYCKHANYELNCRISNRKTQYII